MLVEETSAAYYIVNPHRLGVQDGRPRPRQAGLQQRRGLLGGSLRSVTVMSGLTRSAL